MFKSFFKKKAGNELKKPSPIDDNVFTIVCVLVEAALVDNNFGDEEKNIIIKLLQKQYKIKILQKNKNKKIKLKKIKKMEKKSK